MLGLQQAAFQYMQSSSGALGQGQHYSNSMPLPIPGGSPLQASHRGTYPGAAPHSAQPPLMPQVGYRVVPCRDNISLTLRSALLHEGRWTLNVSAVYSQVQQFVLLEAHIFRRCSSCSGFVMPHPAMRQMLRMHA